MIIRRHQTNNRGMTLVELLVAIVLLAIVVVPLLHTFVSSARANQKARERLRLTTAAQDIMEGLKADSIEELAYQFNYPDVMHASNPDIKEENEFHVLRRDLIKGTPEEVRVELDEGTREASGVSDVDAGETDEDKSPSVRSTDGGVTYNFTEKPSGKYFFTMDNVTLQNMQFDALVEIDATRYRVDGSITEDTARHNEKEVIDITGMDAKYDAFFVQPADMMATVVQEMNTKFVPATALTTKDLSMKIAISTSSVMSAGKTLTKAKVIYTFTTDVIAPETDPYEYQKEYDFFSNYATGAELRNVYLFYFPLYEARHSIADVIEYSNPDSIPSTLYIVKQQPVNTVGLSMKEQAYHCRFNLIEAGTRSDPITKFRTNLGKNLFDVYTPEATPTSLSGIEYCFNGGAMDPEPFGVGNLSGEQVIDRVFDITIDLYRSGAHANGFPIADKLTTLSGSKN